METYSNDSDNNLVEIKMENDNITIVKEIPDWELIESIEVEELTWNAIKNKSELRCEMFPIETNKKLQIKIAKFPFSKGCVSYAYYAVIYIERTWELHVVKTFIFDKERQEDELKDFFIEQNEQSKIASFLTNIWNKKKIDTKKVVRYVESKMVKFVNSEDKPVYYNVELFLEGRWVKWSNNSGFVDIEAKELLHFSQWTYEYTNGYFMITDLQGVESVDGYLLSDPAVLTLDTTKFWYTNCFPKMQMKICLRAIKHTLNGNHNVNHSSSSKMIVSCV